MSRENVIKFNNPIFFLEFCVYDYNDNETNLELKVGCGEDIENYMQAYFDENWDELFYNKLSYDTNDISYVIIEGMGVIAQDENLELWANIPSRTTWQYNIARIKFDMKILEDENAKKIQKIREIIS